MTAVDTETDTPTVPAQIAGVTIYVTCPCGSLDQFDIDCAENDSGIWSAPIPERFHLCESCRQVIDTGLRVTVGAPE
jgi:hypothetical protein